MLQFTSGVGKAEVDIFNVFFLDFLDNIAGSTHVFALSFLPLYGAHYPDLLNIKFNSLDCIRAGFTSTDTDYILDV